MSELKEIREKILGNIKEVVERNREEVEEAYKITMKLEHIARKQGLLALEYEVQFIPKDTLLCNEMIEMVELIVSGTEPEIFEELITIKFFAMRNYTGIKGLLYFLYARSLLMIQAGQSSYMIERLFQAVIPSDLMFFEQERMMFEEYKNQKISEWKQSLTETERGLLRDMSVLLKGLLEAEWKIVVGANGFYGFDKILPYLEEETKILVKNHMNDYRYFVIMQDPTLVKEQELVELKQELEEFIRRLRNRETSETILDTILQYNDDEIQLLLRTIDNLTLALALKHIKAEIAECFFRNISLRLKQMILEDMEYMGPVKLSDVEDAQRKIMRVADVLGICKGEKI